MVCFIRAGRFIIAVHFESECKTPTVNHAGWVITVIILIKVIGTGNRSSEKNGKNNPTGVIESQLALICV